MIVQDDKKWTLQLYADTVEDINDLNSKKYDGYDLRVVLKKPISLTDTVLDILNKFYSVVIYFDYNFDMEKEEQKSIKYIKEMQRLGFGLYFKAEKERWKQYEVTAKYRVLPSFILVRTKDSFITLNTDDAIKLFNRTLEPVIYSKFDNEEKEIIDLLIEEGVIKKYGDYVFNVSLKVRKNVNYDWE